MWKGEHSLELTASKLQWCETLYYITLFLFYFHVPFFFLPPANAEIQNIWIYTSTPITPYLFMTYC
jgi:hypothetical protein